MRKVDRYALWIVALALILYVPLPWSTVRWNGTITKALAAFFRESLAWFACFLGCVLMLVLLASDSTDNGGRT